MTTFARTYQGTRLAGCSGSKRVVAVGMSPAMRITSIARRWRDAIDDAKHWRGLAASARNPNTDLFYGQQSIWEATDLHREYRRAKTDLALALAHLYAIRTLRRSEDHHGR